MRLRVIGIFVVAALTALSIVPVVALTSSSAEAATGSSFDAGRIISDALFYDGDSISASEVQAFLRDRGSNCIANSQPCLKDYHESTWTRAADAMCASYAGAANESAATIISKVGLACGISPKVLLVLLEKEQSLVTRSTPSAGAFRSATGYACPDTAPCNSQYYGFYNQVYMAAWQFRRYENPAGTTARFTWYAPGTTPNIQFHPDAARCGSAPVYISNRATAALYYYTPYQPNAAALGNLYSYGDDCSSYGNRNFWRLYTDWFGSTTGDPNFSVDSIRAEWGTIRVTGWAKANGTDASQYVWINIDGVGGAVLADRPLTWFPGYFSGHGPLHGFDATYSATPGVHRVCVYNASTAEPIRCETVTVPRGVGALDSVVGVPGGTRITGWSVDALSSGRSYIWVNVDGQGGPFQTNVDLGWLPALIPGVSTSQGYDIVVPTTPGRHEICVYGAEALLGCRTVDVPAGSGNLDTATGGPGRIDVSGWFVDYSAKASSSIQVTLDGVANTYSTNVDLPWLSAYLPGMGTNHGFSLALKAPVGTHRVCVSGVNASVSAGCATVSVPYSVAGAFDSAVVSPGKVRVTGWSVDLMHVDPGYIWINVDGQGGAYRADVPLNWFEALYPGAGLNHGFDVTLDVAPGTHEICISGASSAFVSCRTVTVP